MNPLDVLTGAMIMCGRERMASENGALWLDEAHRYRLSLNAEQQALGLHLDGPGTNCCTSPTIRPARRPWRRRDRARGGAASFSLQTIIACARRPGIPCCFPTAAGSSACAARPRSSGRSREAGIDPRLRSAGVDRAPLNIIIEII